MEMERGSIPQVNAAARSRGMSYGQYVGAAYYPVTILQVLPDGSRILRTAPVPEPVMVERPVGVTEKPRKEKPAKPKKERKRRMERAGADGARDTE